MKYQRTTKYSNYCSYESPYIYLHKNRNSTCSSPLRSQRMNVQLMFYHYQLVCTAQLSNSIDSDSIKFFTVLNGSLSIDSSCGNVIIEENWIAY